MSGDALQEHRPFSRLEAPRVNDKGAADKTLIGRAIPRHEEGSYSEKRSGKTSFR
jgi:hypothetical protein